LCTVALTPPTSGEAPSRSIIAALLARGARITVYDPVAMEEARRAFSTCDDADYANSADQALEGADALLLITECANPALLAALGIDYEGIGGLHRPKKGRTWHCDCSVAFSG
jgi:UDP-N-acetyl-D-mannosaminuronate dehydrogenase